MRPKLALSIRVQEPKPYRTATVEGARVTIGSRSDADVRVDDPRVAPAHAVIETDEAGTLTLVDLGSESGTFVGGERVSRKKLELGDHIEIGASTLELVSAEPVLKAASGSYRESPRVEQLEVAAPPAPVPPPRPDALAIARRGLSLLALLVLATVYLVRHGATIPRSGPATSLSLSWPPSQLVLLLLLGGLVFVSGDAFARRADGSRTPLARLLLVCAAIVASPVLVQLAFALFTVGGMAIGIISLLAMAGWGLYAVIKWIARGTTD